MKREVLGSVPRMACWEKWRVVVARIVGVWAEIWVKGVKGVIGFVEIKKGVLYDEMVECRDRCGVIEAGVCEC